MSFRQKLFLSIVVAVLITVLIESGVDFMIERNRAAWQAQTEGELRQYTREIVNLLDLDDLGDRAEEEAQQHLREIAGLFELNDEALAGLVPGASIGSPSTRQGRFRIVLGDEILLSSAAFPESSIDWAIRDRDLSGGYYLEVALERTPAERILNNPVLLQVIDLPLFFALAFMVAGALTRLVMRPIRELTRAVRELSRQRFPEPVTVPSGDDELGQLAESFNLMTHSIQNLLERERSFTRYASHELRTPLSALKVQLEALDMELLPAEEVIPALERNITRMEEVLTALLTLARSAERDAAPVVLRGLIQEVLEIFPDAFQQRLSVIDRARARLEVTDAQLVHQALRNLLENAFRYSDGPVTLSVEEASETVALRVKDSGPGVPEATIRELTKPFFRLGSHAESLGLGLALVENVTRSVGGRLELKNTHPGLEAALTLPIYRESKALRSTRVDLS
jgi:signal transduction histidine kinase